MQRVHPAKAPEQSYLPFYRYSVFPVAQGRNLRRDLVYKMNNGFIENMDTQNFKELLSFELPLVDIVYNSGKVNLTGEIQDLIRMIFGIETRLPSSILSAEAAFLKNYYTNHYMSLPEYAGIREDRARGK